MKTAAKATLIDLLRQRAADQTDVRGYTFLNNGTAGNDELTYGELDRRSREIAARLQMSFGPGERVLLLYHPGLEFLPAFFGCLYAGALAVPTYPPSPIRPAQSLPRLQAIASEAGVRAVLTTAAVAAQLPGLFDEVPALAGLEVLATDLDPSTDAAAWRAPALGPAALAFLQYTSGSTATPKGVMVSHGNLLANLADIRARAGFEPDCVGVSWLPAHHDLGLLGGLLQPLFAGFPSYLMSPVAFIQNPSRWLEAISRYRAHVSGGPNFAYDLCVRKTTPEQRQGLDLRCWRVAYNGAEPIRRQTLNNFCQIFGPHGFDGRAFCPGYGLAEATLLVTGGRLPDALVDAEVVPPASEGKAALVSCGCPSPGTEVVITDPESRTPLAPGEEGEIWVAGPGVAQGYWNRPEETQLTFQAFPAAGKGGPYLRTGDLGYLKNGELFVTGRIKDLLIIRGRKHYPQDLEQTIESSHPAIWPNGVAALSLSTSDGERLGVVVEVSPRLHGRSRRLAECGGKEAPEVKELIGNVRQAVAEAHELQTHTIVLVPPGSIPRTTSGKLQRHACCQRLLTGTLETIVQWPAPPNESDYAARGPD